MQVCVWKEPMSIWWVGNESLFYDVKSSLILKFLFNRDMNIDSYFITIVNDMKLGDCYLERRFCSV